MTAAPTNPDEWARNALCAHHGNADLWFAEGERQRLALHLCRSHCPVLNQCRQLGVRFSHGVLAGLAYTQYGRVSDHQVASSADCPTCRQQRERAAGVQTPAYENCGSYAGWKRHRRAGLLPCVSCAEAHRQYSAARRAAAREAVA